MHLHFLYYFLDESMTALPTDKLSVIDLSIRHQGIVDQLMTHLLKVERPEYEAQKHSIEGDVVHHLSEIQEEQVGHAEGIGE